jgi:hypothetical protein
MRSRAGLHADGAWRQRRHQRMQLGSRHARAAQVDLAALVDTVQRKHVLGEIDSNVQNGHDFPFRVS